MTTFPYFTADVFTDQPFGGNQLAVFPDARGIPERRLLDVTREFNYSETTFVYPPERPENTRRVRIFTPAGEIPFAGHPTVGTAHGLAAIGDIPLTGETTRIVFEEQVGLVPVSIRAAEGKPVFAQLTAAKLPDVGPPPPSRQALAAVLGLDPADLLDDAWAPEALSVGLPFHYVPLRDRAAVARARVKLDAWERTLAGGWAPELFVFAAGGERAGTDFRARMFAPGINIPEDPATGSACAALAGYLAPRDPRRSQDGTLRWVVEQGFEMGRPSILTVEADMAKGALAAVRVGGATVMMSRGTMEIS